MVRLLATLSLLTTLLSGARAHDTKCCSDFPPSMCRAYFVKYKYDRTTNKCVEAVWGGCPEPEATDNFFHSMEDCASTCAGVECPQADKDIL